MPKVKKKSRVTKSQSFKINKELIMGIAIGAIIIFVFCLMIIPGQTSV